MADFQPMTARAAVAAVARGDRTVESILRDSLDRIASREPAIGAWQHLDGEAALEAARMLDRRGPGGGAMRGALFAAKDVIATGDMPTGFGSAAYAGHRPHADASCVALARAAGALLIGKTVSTEFAGVSPGPTRHPADPAHTPGGSSSGSAAAVAADMVPIALGTQTAGSTIRPAAFCGVVGYKPSYDLIDKTGVKTLAAGLDTVGVIAGDVRDAAFYTAQVTARPSLEPGAEPPRPRVALYRSEAWPNALPEAQTALDRAIDALGGDVAEIALLPGYDRLLDLHQRLMDWGMTTGLAYERIVLAEAITPQTLAFLAGRAEVASPALYDAAMAEAAAARAAIDRLFGAHDVLLTPPATGEAPEGLASTGDASFNRGWTALGLPCITVPTGVGRAACRSASSSSPARTTMPGCFRPRPISRRRWGRGDDRRPARARRRRAGMRADLARRAVDLCDPWHAQR